MPASTTRPHRAGARKKESASVESLGSAIIEVTDDYVVFDPVALEKLAEEARAIHGEGACGALKLRFPLAAADIEDDEFDE